MLTDPGDWQTAYCDIDLSDTGFELACLLLSSEDDVSGDLTNHRCRQTDIVLRLGVFLLRFCGLIV